MGIYRYNIVFYQDEEEKSLPEKSARRLVTCRSSSQLGAAHGSAGGRVVLECARLK
jgi:hypothetical protein